MKYVFTIDVQPPMGKPVPWGFTLRVQEYRQGRPYGGAAVEEITMAKRANYTSTMKYARRKLKEMATWALT
jgi:hypothetical protein